MSVPAVRPRFIDKARSIPADVIVFDLEDSVPVREKARARSLLAETLRAFPRAGRLLFVRPNGLTTGLLEEDLAAVVGPWLDGLHLPKVDSPDVVRQVDHYLTFLERTRGLPDAGVRLMAWIESAEGVTHVERISQASPRLVALSMGAEDYTTSLGVTRTRGGEEIAYARARVANAAAAAGLGAIDCPESDYKDLDHFEREVGYARSIGYRGKYCIHPDQVAVANRLFAPSAEEIAWARRVVDAYNEAEDRGEGAIAVDGRMVDVPVYVRAVALLDRQVAIEARTGHIAASDVAGRLDSS